jgi:hypothetical protein
LFAQYDPNYVPGQVRNNAEIFWHEDGTPFLQNGYLFKGPT